MSNVSIPVEIATAIKAALTTELERVGASRRAPVVADGINDDSRPNGDEITFPLAAIMINECDPQQYRSALRSFEFTLDLATRYQDDTDQTILYENAHYISQWLAEPALSLELAVWDALIVDGSPERDSDGFVQYFRWTGTVKTRKATT